MLWRRSTQAPTSRPATPVPEGESVRMAALQRSWRRDRWVAKRRLWLRWTLWGAQRYGIPAAGVLGVVAGLWFAVRATMAWIEAPSPGEPPALSAQPAPTVAALPSESIPAPKPAAEPTKLPPAGDSDASAPVLAFKPSLRVTARSETPVSSAAPLDAAKIPNPQLISENWLHSKEP